MILGVSISTFTLLHVVLSLIAIAAGFIVVAGMFASRKQPAWTAFFLATTVLTSVTGFFFPVDKLLPSHVVGILSLLALALAVVAFYGYRLGSAWRWIYIVAAIVALYFNVFVAVVQAFLKVPVLHSLAPTQQDAPFVIAQLGVLVVFIAVGIVAVRRFRPDIGAPVLHRA